MISVTCVVHHGEVEKEDTLPLPDGPVCRSCYIWMEEVLSNENNVDDDFSIYEYVYGDEEEDEEEDDDDD